MYKKDFPLYATHPDLIYLDNAATVQKPQRVLNEVHHYLTHSYANVHRGLYDLSQDSEEMFRTARKTIADWHGVRDDEVIFTGGTTQGMNMLTATLRRSGRIDSESIIVLSSGEHHANIVPRQILADDVGATIKRVATDGEGFVRMDQLQQIMNDGGITLVAVQSCSNVTGAIQDLAQIRQISGDETLLVVDASQSQPHYHVNLQSVRPDFLLWTGHKLGAHTGCGVIIAKKKHLDALIPGRGGGGAIQSVTTSGHTYQGSPDKFEPGTPNLIGAVSMAAAVRYIESIGGLHVIQTHEAPLVDYCLEQSLEIEKISDLRLIGPRDSIKRIGVFSYTSKSHNLHQLGQQLAQHHIAVRTGGQCAHPLHAALQTEGTLRMSLWMTNSLEDCKKFFEVLKTILPS